MQLFGQKRNYTSLNDRKIIKNEAQDELIKNRIDSIMEAIASSDTKSKLDDDSIIDVTDNSYSVDSGNGLLKYSNGVPYWAHHYVYSCSEINEATNDQKKFYSIFKKSFLNGEYFDLEGNTNYAFILLFDLLDEYDISKDIYRLECQLKTLGQCYQKTKSYGASFLIKIMEATGDSDGIARLKSENKYSNEIYNADFKYWKLGSKYREKLSLNDEQVELLNKLWYPNNNFCSIEYCCIEILKIYIFVIAELKAIYMVEGKTIDALFLEVADVIARKQYRYKNGTQNYKYCIERTVNDFYSNIFKYCENTVRECYGHKRKINTDTYYTAADAKAEYETKIIAKITSLLTVKANTVAPPDEATEIELYSKNTNRWKIRFGELTANYIDNPKWFYDSVVALGQLNKKNPSIENIFFEASKFIASYDKTSALSLYIYYLYYDLKSETFNNKKLTKTIQKSLFNTKEQLHDFEIIVSKLIEDKDLEKALEGVMQVYEAKRKKIELNPDAIKEAQQQHSGTVEQLAQYLIDNYEDDNNSIKSQVLNDDEIIIEISKKNEADCVLRFAKDLSFSPIHITTLELFLKNDFSIQQAELETFAKSKGVLKNQLIDSINEVCYDLLDDILIEEEDGYYTINKSYFQKITTK